MKKLALLLVAASIAAASPVGRDAAGAAAAARLRRDCMAGSRAVRWSGEITSAEGSLLAYSFDLAPAGYLIVSADDDLPPVMAYSYTDGLSGPEGSFGMADLVALDLQQRLALLDVTPQETIDANRALWREYLSGEAGPLVPTLLEQWPPEGSTPTGGWLEENWTQTAPYNAYCPMDLIAGARSVAGCPAVAMGMILDNLETSNGTRFDDSDDYYHNYHEFYWIDDDHIAHDFPSWPELDVLLDTLDAHYQAGTPLTSSDKAAIEVASGFACKQVFTASVSGTFGVSQAYDAYLRFGFPESQLLDESSESLFVILPQNMMDARPAHLAIVDPGWQYGHNVVVDGYNTDDFYHINFGWGGSYNGWYSFPLTGMPYGMTVIEGIIVDIGTGPSSVGDQAGEGADALSLTVAANPVSRNPVICLALAEGCRVSLGIYSVDGRLVGELADGQMEAGSHQFCWDAGDLPSGVYLVHACSPLGSALLRMTLLD